MATPLDLLRSLLDATQDLGGLLEGLSEGGELDRSGRRPWHRIGAAARDIYLAARLLAQQLDEEDRRSERPNRTGEVFRRSRGTRRAPRALNRTRYELPRIGSDLCSPPLLRASDELVHPRATIRFDRDLYQAIRRVAQHRGLNTAAAIRESVICYATLFGPRPGFVFRENRAFTIQFANAPALDLLGYRLEELVGRSMRDVYDEPTQHQSEITSEMMQTGGVRNALVGVRKKSGETLPMRLFAEREVRAARIPRIYASWWHV
jgi:PAS domain S-box-containing protein